MEDVSAHQAMKSAAFKALSSLCANDTEAALRVRNIENYFVALNDLQLQDCSGID